MINRKILLSKLHAFGIHLAISFVIFCVLLYFIIFEWYPIPFFTSDGGWQGIRLIAAIDLVLGPILTFIIFNPIKSRLHLRLDLSLIALCQIAALIWGTWTVHNERPYLIVFSDGIFYPLAFYQVAETGLNNDELTKLTSTSNPKKVYVDIPLNKTEYMALLQKAIATNQPIHFMGDRYRTFDESQLKNISRWNIDMKSYLKGEPFAWLEKYQQFSKKFSDHLKEIQFFTLKARYGSHIIAFNNKTMKFIEILDIPPPKMDEVIWGKEKAKARRKQNKVIINNSNNQNN